MNTRKPSTRLTIAGLTTILFILLALVAPAAGARGPPPPGGKVLVRGAQIHGANGIMFDSHE